MKVDRKVNGRILFIGGSPEGAESIGPVLDEAGYSFFTAVSVEDAADQLEFVLPDLIMFDGPVPDEGEACKQLISIENACKAHVISLTSPGESEDSSDRQVDCMIWPVAPEVFLAGIRARMKIASLKRELNGAFGQVDEIVAARTADLVRANESLRLEIASRRHADEYRDSLLAQMIKAGEQARDQQLYAQLYLDMMGEDINSMSQSALGYLDIALKTLDSEGRLDWHHRSLIEKPAGALKDSSRVMGTVSRLQAVLSGAASMRPVGVCAAINEAVSDCEISKGRDVVISFMPVPEIRVYSNDMLKDIFFNIISGAIRHSPPASPLTVEVHAKVVREDSGEFAWVTIEDDGPGIPEDKKLAVFRRVRHGLPDVAGSGLGLYLVRMLVEDFGGMIWVENRIPEDYRKGSKYVIVLPLSAQA